MKYIFYPLWALMLLCLNLTFARENPWTSARPDGHAPMGVMGDHYHHQGEWMFSLRYMPMWMENNLNGKESLGNSDIFQEYLVAPQKMVMNMYMLGVMYAVTDNFTLMLMTNYLSNTMDLKTRTNVDFETASSGLGDISLYGLV